MALTELQCKKAEAKEKQYRMSDTNGLSLIIDPNGQKYWSVRFTVNGSRKSKGLGKYPEIGLKTARELTYEVKHNLPDETLEEAPKPTFSEVAEVWFNEQRETWSPKHIQNVRASLDELCQALGLISVDKISAPEILKVIKKIELRGSLEIAKRTLSRCGMVMKYSIAHGYRLDDPTHGLTNALKPQKVTNLASLPIKEIPRFLANVKAYPCSSQIQHAIIIIMLTGVRVSELLNACWEEFDIENKVWDIPAERMKNSLPHRVTPAEKSGHFWKV